MKHQCPICRIDLGKRKLDRLVVARMEMDCPGCKGRLRLNVHPWESTIVYVSFAAFVVLAGLGYWLQDQRLLLWGLVSGLLGVSAIPVLERTWLRAWPRYIPCDKRADL